MLVFMVRSHLVWILSIFIFALFVQSQLAFALSSGSSYLGSLEGREPITSVPIYRNSTAFSHLAHPSFLAPGVALHNDNGGQVCSGGWFFEKGDKVYISTAGHCGKKGDNFSLHTPQGVRHIGTVIVSEYTGKNDLGVRDFALIELVDEDLIGSFLPIDPQWISAELVYEYDHNPEFKKFDRICGLGFRSGLSCGSFEAIHEDGSLIFRRISDVGDSGGPVFGVRGQVYVPLAIGSAGQFEDATQSMNQSIFKYVDKYGLKVKFSK